MNNERFAQGEWTVNEKIMVAVNCGKKHIALVNIYNDGTDKSVLKDECLANAHLISAAPDMYRALQNINQAIIDSNNEIELADAVTALCHDISQVLAKADGEV